MTAHTSPATRDSQIPKGYKQTEVGVIPSDWSLEALERLILSTEYGSSAKSDPQGMAPVLRMGNIQGGKIDWDDLVYTDDEAEFRKYRLRSGDVLFNRTNTIDLVGKTAIYNGEQSAIFAGYLIRINVDKTVLDAKFLNYILNTEFTRKHSAKVLSVAVGQANINAQKLRAYPIPLPPTLAEQTAIATALSDTDGWIVSLEGLVAKKRHLKQAAMQQLLTGKKRLPGFDGEWETSRIGDSFKISGGLSASRDQLSHEGICYLHYGDIHGSTKTFIDVERDYQTIPKLDVPLNKVSPSALLSNGDIVFVDASEDVEGTNRHVVIVNSLDTPFISGLHTIVAKPKTDDLEPLYCRYCFQAEEVKRQFRFFAVGTKVSGVSKTNIAKIEFLAPERDEQTAIATVLSDMDSEITSLESKLTKARAIKQGMMSNLLTGKIRLVEN